ncbi:MAG: MarR family winged helix-turn-helix transcriptional regulator [Desulfobacterales bacterium]|nr:MarR family winged helix-turn-helix transcriptional regulator [Desulfobacterales bacterium]
MHEMAAPKDQRSEPIENQVLVALRRIIRSIDMHSRTLSKFYGLTGPQLIVLQELSKNDEITPGSLAKAISLSQATVTGILDRLEKRDLIKRRRSKTDRRRVWVSTTAQADHMLNTGPPIMQVSFIEAFKRLQDWEQTMILSSLQHLVALMNAETVDAAPILATDASLSASDESQPLWPTNPATE